MDIPRIPLPFKQETTDNFSNYISNNTPQSSAEATSAALELGQFDAALNLYGRYLGAQDLENSGVTPISAQEANNRYPDIPVPFREPINPYVAQLQYDNLKYKDELQRKIENGPSDWWTKSKVFGAGLLAHLMDPIEFGAGAILGWGAGGLISKGVAGQALKTGAEAVASGTAKFTTRLAVNTAEAGSGNLVQNIGQEAATALTVNKEGGTYNPDSSEVLKDLAFNTFAATAVGVGIKEGAFHLNGLKRILKQTSPEADLAIARTTIGNLENDIRPNPTPILETLAKETSVRPQDMGLPAYDYTPGIEGKTLYAATRDASPSLHTGTKASLGDDFGMGTQITDNPGVANAAASRAMSDAPGAIHDVNLQGELHPINLNESIPDNLKELISADLKELGFKQGDIDKMSMHDVLSSYQNSVDNGEISPEIMQRLKRDFLERGYNALISDGKTHLGVEHTPHNLVTVLDDNLIKENGFYSPDRGVINQPTKEMVDKVSQHTTDFKNHTLVDATNFDEMQAKIDSLPENISQESIKLKDDVAASLDDLKQLQEQGILSSEDSKAIESLTKEFNDLETKASVIKAAAGCIGF